MMKNKTKNKMTMVAVAVLTAGITFSQGVPIPPLPSPGGIDTKQKSPRREAKRLERISREGGLVKKPATGKCVRFVNAQKLVDPVIIENVAGSVEQRLHVSYEVVSGEPGKQYLPDDKAAAVITITESGDAPTILIAPEAVWAVVNVTALAKDKPDKDVLAARVVKETWRAFAIAMGAANSPYKPCLLRNIFSLSDLDAESTLVPMPYSFNAIESTAKALKIGERYVTTYQRACQEGWAEQPTNDVQRVIWEAVKAEQSKSPTKGIKIKYDPKTGK